MPYDTIQIRSETKEMLKKLKGIESFDAFLVKLLALYNNQEVQPCQI